MRSFRVGRFVAGLAACFALATTAPARASAQKDPRVEIALPAVTQRGTEAPTVHTVGLLLDRRMQDLLINGFPARLHHRLEVWTTGGWFNSLAAHIEWDVIVRYSPLERRYTVVRIEGDKITSSGTYATIAEVEDALSTPYQPLMRPPHDRGTYYYNLLVDIEMLSANDLDEVERWLRGELQPAVQGKKNPGTVVARGVRELVIQLLGGQQRHYEARSGKFSP